MSLAQEFGENCAVKALLALIAVTAVWGVTFVQVKDAVAIYPLFAFLAIRFAIATGTLALPAANRVRDLGRSGAVGGAFLGLLLVTGGFASALGYLVQTWAQRRTSATRTALVFTMEPVWTAFFGYTLAGDRLGALGWGGCAAIMAGIVLAEPAAASVLAGKLDTLRLRFSQ